MAHKVDNWGLKVGPAGPEKLLEDCWFFGNTKMSSITSSHDNKSCQQTYESIEKLSVNNPTTKGSIEVGRRRRRSQEASPKNSLPASASVEDEDEDEDEEEMEFSMGKLIRQASLTHSHTFPPKKQVLNCLLLIIEINCTVFVCFLSKFCYGQCLFSVNSHI